MRHAVPGALAALLLLTACTGSATPAPGPSPDTSRPLIVASGADLTSSTSPGIRRALVDEWNKRNPDRPARIVELPNATDDQRSELVGALQSGTARYDVVNLDITWIPEFADSGLIRPLDDFTPALVDDDFLPKAAETGRWKDHTYAVPFNTDVGLLYYRTDDLRTASGLDPSHLADYDSVSDLLAEVEADSARTYTTQLRAYEGLTVNTLEAFWTVGVNLIDREGRYIGTEDDLRKGLSELRSLTRTGNFNDESLEADESVSLAQFTEGASVLMRNWPYAYNRLDAALDTTGFGVARLPGTAALGGQSLGISATSERAADAADLIRFLTSRKSQRALLQAGFAPARHSVYGTKESDCAADNPAAWYHNRPAGKGSEPSASPSPGQELRPGYTTLLWCALNEAGSRPATAHYVTFTRLIQREVRRMLADNDVDQAARRLQARLAKALGGR